MSSALADVLSDALRSVELEVAAEEQREIQLTQTEQWARDPVGWINQHVWIASKFSGNRNRVRPQRMRLFPDQERTVAAWIDLDHLVETGELVFTNVVVEKSRQIGETWLFAVLILWALIFHGVQGLCLNRKAAEVADNRWTPKSLFGRIRYAYRKLDAAAVPPGTQLEFRPFSNAAPASITNERTGAAVLGEAQSDDPGRGGTFDFALADEAAFMRHGESVYAAIDEACPDGKALLSTVNGSDNFHARIADEQPEGWTYLRLHWSTHPVYSQGLHVAAIAPSVDHGRRVPGRLAPQPTAAMREAAEACTLCRGTAAGLTWNSRAPRAHRFPGKLTSPHYDRAVVGKTVEQVAAELDIDRERSLTARVYDEFSADTHVVPEIPYAVELPIELGWDYGIDCTSVVICQDHPLEYRVIGEVELVDRPGETPTPELVAEAVRRELISLGVEPRFATPDWTRRLYARGDPAGDARSLSTGRPLTADYRRLGFHILAPPRSLTATVDYSIKAVKSLLLGVPKPVRVSAARCPQFVRHARHNRWPTDAQGARRVGVTTPLDDDHNHMMRAFAYLIVSKFPPKAVARGAEDPWDDVDDGAPDPGRRRPRRRGGVFDLLEDARPLGYDSPS